MLANTLRRNVIELISFNTYRESQIKLKTSSKKMVFVRWNFVKLNIYVLRISLIYLENMRRHFVRKWCKMLCFSVNFLMETFSCSLLFYWHDKHVESIYIKLLIWTALLHSPLELPTFILKISTHQAKVNPYPK